MARIMTEEDSKFILLIELFIHTNAEGHMRRHTHTQFGTRNGIKTLGAKNKTIHNLSVI